MTGNRGNKPNLSGVYGIIDPVQVSGRDLEETVEPALAAGIRLLQLRCKSDSPAQRLRQAERLQGLCRRYRTPLLINDDVALCQAVGATGVHLGQQDTPLPQARDLLGPEAIIGITCHQSLDLALRAEQDDADYVAFGRFFPSRSKPDAPRADIRILREAKQRLSIPVVAIGGINAENGASLLAAGADMLAVIQALFGAADVAASAAGLVNLFTSNSQPAKESS